MMKSVDEPIGIIAGGHNLPLEIADALREAGQAYFLIGLVGEADKAIESHPHMWLKWGQVGLFFKTLETKGIEKLLFVGSITNRPDFKSIKLDRGAISALPDILRIVSSGGDEGVLGGVARFFEKRGLSLLSVVDLVPSIIVGAEFSLSNGHVAASRTDIHLASRAAKTIGALDAGQGVVVAEGRILAMEGPEGTDQMLQRVETIREQGRARWDFGKRGILYKCARPGQDLRFDIPTIGPQTIENVKKAGLAGIVCARDEVLCIAKSDTKRLAQEAGLFLQAMDSADT